MIGTILDQTFLGNTCRDYLVAVGVALAGLAVVLLLRRVVAARLRPVVERTANGFDDFLLSALQRGLLPLLAFGAVYLGTRHLTLGPLPEQVLDVAGMVLMTLVGIRFLVAALEYAVQGHLQRQDGPALSGHAAAGVRVIARIVIWSLGAIFLLDNLGFQVSTVIAGLGIGGVAVALAAQTILADLFSFFAILFDRPFEVGDTIRIGDFIGTVEHVGMKTTRLRSLGGEQTVFANKDLTSARLDNFKRMEERRVLFRLGVTYDTPLEQLKAIPGIIEAAVLAEPGTRFDRAHFMAYGDFSLIFEVVYFIRPPGFLSHADALQAINLAIKAEFDRRGIQFAFPTQTLNGALRLSLEGTGGLVQASRQ